MEIITNSNIETQEELLEYLNKEGYNTTQATVSRDIRELKLNKISYGGNRQKYAVSINADYGTAQSYKQVLTAGIISVDFAENLIVIKTVSGVAMAVGAALDNLNIEGIMGCIAGDDTLFIAVKSSKIAPEIMEQIKKSAYIPR